MSLLRRQLPNHLTLLRLVLAGAFFLILNQYRYPSTGNRSWWLIDAIVVFLLAAATDLLDGYLARRWKAESAFGRIMDPFCDKVLILGAFIYLCGPRFSILKTTPTSDVIITVTGVYPWMVVIMLARELLVTAMRSRLEDTGIRFGANLFGKLKMFLQSVTVPLLLLIVGLDPQHPDHAWLAVPRDILVYTTVIATVLSGLPYISSARSALNKTSA